MELERHRAHLDDVGVILRLAFGAFPSYLIDLLLGAALLAHDAAACSVPRRRTQRSAGVVTRAIKVAVVSSTGPYDWTVIYARIRATQSPNIALLSFCSLSYFASYIVARVVRFPAQHTPRTTV